MNEKIKTETIEREIEMPTPTQPPTTVAEAVMNTELKHVNATMARIEGKFDKAIEGFASKERVDAVERANNAKNKEQDEAIKKLEDWNTWAVRIVLAAVILAGMGLVLVKT